MSIFQSFQTGLAMGQQQRKERDRDTARKSAADAFKAGNYEMAPTALMEVGDFEAANAYTMAGDRAKTEKRRETYGETFKTGGWTGLGEMAAGQGDFETAGYAQGQARAKTLQDWEDHDRAITVQKQGVEFLATSAGQLRSLPMEARGQAAMDIIAKSPFADNPQVMQAVQQAAADGRITDEELTAFEEQMLTYAEKLEGQRWQKTFDRGVLESDRSHNLAVKQANTAGSAGGDFGVSPVYGIDANGNRVILQTSRNGGVQMAQLPEGVTLEDPYGVAYDRKLGATAATAEAERTPALMGVEAAEADMARLSSQIDLAIQQTNKDNTGFFGQANPFAGDLAATLKTIRASGAFTSLVNLKAQGGTLGALSDTELQLLEAKIANVERSQNEKQLDANLMELKRALEGSTQRIRAAYEKEYAAGRFQRSGQAGGAAAPAQAPAGNSLTDLISKYID